MTTAMGSPPPNTPNTNAQSETERNYGNDESSGSAMALMAPPPPKNPKTPNTGETLEQIQDQPQEQPEEKQEGIGDSKLDKLNQQPKEVEAPRPSSVPYTIPEWGGPPCHDFYLEVLKDGVIIDQLKVCEKEAYMFGRADICDFVLEHPTISRFHAVLQFRRSGAAYLFDLGSTHGSFVNKNRVEKRVYMDLHVGDVLRFGCSTRLYIFQGPSDLMPPEKDLKIIRESKLREELLDREASLGRARREASMADGISWGINEDAIEEDEDDVDEVTWQTYKGQLTEKQEKTRQKVVKRMEKVGHMKKEIASIRAKDISQGGLTQGQQTQIARNEQRIAQLMEELENLEETLNDSIRESLGARTGKTSHCKEKAKAEDDEEVLSDEDEFYDRTKKASTRKGGEAQSVETADTLLGKRDGIMKEIEEKEKLLSVEKNKIPAENTNDDEPRDALDAYMSGLSSQLVHDKTAQLQDELYGLQSELDRITYLLKIADPTGEAAKKRDLNLQKGKSEENIPPLATKRDTPIELKKSIPSEKPAVISGPKIIESDEVSSAVGKCDKPVSEKIATETSGSKSAVFTVVKPQWLGAVEETEVKERSQKMETVDAQEQDEFVDYKDRKKILASTSDSTLENAAPGLIIRKRKQEEKAGAETTNQPSISPGAELAAQDAVALLLKHSRGVRHEEDEEEPVPDGDKRRKDGNGGKKRAKRVLGPVKPSFIDDIPDQEPWVPPKGQTGDGRTSLNDRFGY